MIRLAQIDRTMRPRDVAPGVTLTMRPATSIDVEQAQGEAARVLAPLITAPEALSEFGLEDIVPETGELESLLGLSAYLTSALLMERLVEGWEGVADEAGEALPLDRRVVDAVVEGACDLPTDHLHPLWGSTASLPVDGGVELLACPIPQVAKPGLGHLVVVRLQARPSLGVRPRPGHQPGLVDV